MERRASPSEPVRLAGTARLIGLALVAWAAWWYFLGGFDWSQRQLRDLIPPLRDTVVSFFWVPLLFMVPAAGLCLLAWLVGRKT